MTAAPLFAVRDLRWKISADFTLDVPKLDLPAGRTTLLLGPSASGKSTLLSLLGRVEGSYFPEAVPPERTGTITLSLPGGDHEPLELLELSERQLLKRRVRGPVIGYVFQREGLFAGLDVVENIAWPLSVQQRLKPAEARERATAALARVDLPPNRDVATLSGGERKRLALARTLAADPPVLLLDEPFTGLDPRALGSLLDLVAELASESSRSIVMVTHQRADIDRLGEHVVILRGGQVATSGPREEVAEALNAFLAGELPALNPVTHEHGAPA